MMMVVLASLLTGAVLGLRFRVYALVPAFAVACIATGVPALIDNDAVTAAWQAGAAVLLLQAGYSTGIVTRFVIAAARSTGPSSASLRRSPHQWPIRHEMPLRNKALSTER